MFVLDDLFRFFFIFLLSLKMRKYYKIHILFLLIGVLCSIMDILGFSFFITFLLIHLKPITSDDFKYRIVQYCPHDDIDISKKDKECISQKLKLYYCLKTANHTLVEFCGPVYYFSGKGGCPVYHHGVEDIKFETCVPVEECPPQDSENVVITSFYKYKACFRVNYETHTQDVHNLLTAVRDKTTLESTQRTTAEDGNATSTFIYSTAAFTEDLHIIQFSSIIIAVIVIFALVLTKIILITAILRRITRNDRRLKETMCQTIQLSNNEAWNNIYDFVDENQIDQRLSI